MCWTQNWRTTAGLTKETIQRLHQDSLKKMVFDIKDWKELGLNRNEWRELIRKVCQLFERSLIDCQHLKHGFGRVKTTDLTRVSKVGHVISVSMYYFL